MSALFIVRAQVDSSVRDEIAGARAIPGSAEIKTLIAEFDRAWGDKVTRTRDIVDVVQAL